MFANKTVHKFLPNKHLQSVDDPFDTKVTIITKKILFVGIKFNL